MTPVGVSSRATVVGPWRDGCCQGLSASRVEVGTTTIGYCQELVLGMIVLV
jgi:hypothetical protein